MEALQDPFKDRVVNAVQPPPQRPLTFKLMYPYPDKPDVPDFNQIRSHLLLGGFIGRGELIKLVKDVTHLFDREQNVVHLTLPTIIIGDIHGQFYDMDHMFQKVIDKRNLPETKLLFLGDYVDRGMYSVEVLTMLFALKLNHPRSVIMLRGNHESRRMTEHYTFRSEVMEKYGDESVFDLFVESFECMPIAAVVANEFFCVHGGISPDIDYVADIHKIVRYVDDSGESGPLCDLMWSDPAKNKLASKVNFRNNHNRGCSYQYGIKPVTKFLETNNMKSIIRAHEVKEDGYQLHQWSGPDVFPTVVTIFSAPNYVGSYGNFGAVIILDNSDNKLQISKYRCVPNPFVIHRIDDQPVFHDAFSLQMPQIAETVCTLLLHIVQKYSGTIEDETPLTGHESESFHKALEEDQTPTPLLPEEVEAYTRKKDLKQRIREKIRALGRLERLLKNLRENKAAIQSIKKNTVDGKIPRGLLIEGETAISKFKLAR